jgi:hypothetical protein
MGWFSDVVGSFTNSFQAIGDVLTGQNPADNWNDAVADSNKALGRGDSERIDPTLAASFLVGGYGIGAAAGASAAATAAGTGSQTGLLGGVTSTTVIKTAASLGYQTVEGLLTQDQIKKANEMRAQDTQAAQQYIEGIVQQIANNREVSQANTGVPIQYDSIGSRTSALNVVPIVNSAVKQNYAPFILMGVAFFGIILLMKRGK